MNKLTFNALRGPMVAALVSVATLGCSTSDGSEDQLMVGPISQVELISKESTFATKYQAYTVAAEDKAMVDTWPKDISVDVYFGTWCHDSQREVPRFLKLIAGKNINYQLIALNYEKQDLEGLATANNIKRTPTFVVKQQGKEVGRIIEIPKVSIAADITAMF